jgi:hypothetical protein
MKVFIVNSKPTTGKTLFESFVREAAANNGDDVGVLSIVDSIKDVALFAGWNGKKDANDRKMLADLKDVLEEWNDYPYRELISKIEQHRKLGSKAVFVDCREDKDIERLSKDYNALTLTIKRDVEEQSYGNRADDNVREGGYDIEIDNTQGIEELKEEATTFYELFIKGQN